MGVISSFEERYKILQDELPNTIIIKYDKCNCAYHCRGKNSLCYYYEVTIQVNDAIICRELHNYVSHRVFIKRVKQLKAFKLLFDILFLNDFKLTDEPYLRWKHPILHTVTSFNNDFFYKSSVLSADKLIDELKKDLDIINKVANIDLLD